MKKLLILCFALGLFSTANAQFGVRAGYSLANFSNFESDATGGIHAGVYYRKELGFISIEPGIQYSQKGYRIDQATAGETKERLNYVDLPLLLRVNFLPILNVFVGPQGSLLVSRKYEAGGNTETSTEAIKAYDIAGIVGVGVKLPLNLNAQVSYDFGIQSLNYFNQDVKNNVLKLSVGIDF
ncbi:porin family protein [Algoriphagus persicinus]|uniref:porin family protein n=1 Tax=Algoriphagus persicinus TaxID=3108754 RepID=UPI002B3E7BC1|nr:porin family protein [Algoriphagus sp. E1-3-M2]MEB2783786.1 porin family protein [Algoriphagus sp. E1-3-M2]